MYKLINDLHRKCSLEACENCRIKFFCDNYFYIKPYQWEFICRWSEDDYMFAKTLMNKGIETIYKGEEGQRTFWIENDLINQTKKSYPIPHGLFIEMKSGEFAETQEIVKEYETYLELYENGLKKE